jgi:hypothetical protein
MSHPAGKCAFCGNAGDLTKSHIWPEWIDKILPQTATHHEHQIGRFQTYTPKVPGPQPWSKLKQGHVGTRKPRNTCLRCNSGWMRRIEEATMPFLGSLLLGEPQLLDTFSQRLLATFLCLVTMRNEISSQMRAIPASDRGWLMAHFEPPAGWKIWIARYEGTPRMDQRYCALQIASSPNVPRGLEHLNTQVTSLTIGHVYAHIFSSTAWRNFGGYKGIELTQLWPGRQFDIDTDSLTVLPETDIPWLHETIIRDTIEVS